MTPLWLIWIELAVCGGAIAVAGTVLTRQADVIADKTGWSGAWVGLVLLATVTSLPELATGISSVTVANAPDVAVGNALGACVLNLSYVALLDFIKRDEPLFRCAGHGHFGFAGFGVVMLGLVALGFALAALPGVPSLGHVSIVSPLLLIAYVSGVRSVFLYERAQIAAADEINPSQRFAHRSLAQASTRFALAALVVVGAGIWLPFVASDLALAMQWHTSFVGTLLVAGVTSLPELVVTLAALRIGAVDMAIANLLGSNLFNLLVLAIDDLFFRAGPLLSAVSPVHAVSVASALLMSGLIVVALLIKPGARLWRLGNWAALSLALAYVVNAWLLYRFGS